MITKLLTGIVATMFLVIGTRCLVSPEQVLRNYLERRRNVIFPIKSENVPALAKSSLNIFIVRIWGGLCLGVFLIILYHMVKQLIYNL